MKTFVPAACLALMLTTAATAGSYTEPKIEAPVIVDATTSSSAPQSLPLLMALMVLVVAVSN